MDRIAALTVGFALLAGCYIGDGARLHAPLVDPPPGGYVILEDTGTAVVRVGVPASVNEEELVSVLKRAADERQNLLGRDVLLGNHFFVEAYLVRNGYVSEHFAGRLRRYVPVKNWPNSWDSRAMVWIASLPHDDGVSIRLESARSSQVLVR